MLDDELKMIEDQKMPGKNLKQALLALGYAILSSIAFYIAVDSISPRSGLTMVRVMLLLYYGLMIVSGVYAFLACKNSLKSLQTNKNPRNYIALVLGGLLLLGILKTILDRF